MNKDIREVYQSVLCASQALLNLESQYCDKYGDYDDISSIMHCIAESLNSNAVPLEEFMQISEDIVKNSLAVNN